MSSGFQKYAKLIIFILILVTLALRGFEWYRTRNIVWQPEDRERMIADCIEVIGGRAVRFPMLTEEYCSCSTDTLMTHFTKVEYQKIEQEDYETKLKKLGRIIAECNNQYQEAMFNATELGD